ncbi:MAG: ABC transporter substrate-binding protein, partial [Dehalococcoidia bacterium]|nr:ABC transporter substrate-binding protein [Dehalococcoidia bacterium]
MRISRRPALSTLAALLLIAAVVGCGDDDDGEEETAATAEESEATQSESGAEAEVTTEATESETTAAETETGPGSAGIESNPREVGGFFTLDDGIAVFTERPADEDRTGVTENAIKIGKQTPCTGPLAAISFTAQVQVLFDAVNEAGGIHGRQLELVEGCHDGSPAQGTQAVRQLVEQEQVFALSLGQSSPVEGAVAEFTVAAGVPTVFSLMPAAMFGEPTEPLRVSGLPPNISIGRALGEYARSEKPDARIAIIYANDDFGRSILPPFELLAEETEVEIVITASFDPTQVDLSPQVQQAVDEDPDFIVIEAQAPHALQALGVLRNQIGSDIPVMIGVAFPSIPAGQEDADGVVSVIHVSSPLVDEPAVLAAKELMESNGLEFNNLALVAIGPLFICS